MATKKTTKKKTKAASRKDCVVQFSISKPVIVTVIALVVSITLVMVGFLLGAVYGMKI